MAFQMTFADLERQGGKRTTRRAAFLERMDAVTPWADLVAVVDPHRPHDRGGRGRRPWPTETLLRMYLAQCWLGLSDEGTEDACYDSAAVRAFVGVAGGVPDATTLLRFRRLVEDRGLDAEILAAVNARLEAAGMMMRGGSSVDATIIDAPSSTKNREGARDPEMHQARKGNQWYHGMKAHVAVDAMTGYAHSAEYTAANEADVNHCAGLLRSDDRVAWGDSGYRGAQRRCDEAGLEVEFRVAARKSDLARMHPVERSAERRKASVRSHVEHVFRTVKGVFGFRKCPYRGLRKNGCRVTVLLAGHNLLLASRSGRAGQFLGA